MKTFAFDLQLFSQSPLFNFTATGIGKETTFGTPVTPTAWVSAQDITMTGTNQWLERTSARQQIGRELAETGPFGGTGSFTMETDPDVIRLPLAWALGTESIALNAAANNPTTTVAGLFNAASSIGATTVVVAAPTTGTGANLLAATGFVIKFSDSASQEYATIVSVTGSGPYTITLSNFQGTGSGAGGDVGLVGLRFAHTTSTSYRLIPAYDHTLTLGIPRPTFTVQFNRLTDCVAYAGNKVSQLDITLNPRSLVAMRFGTIYATEAIATPATSAFSSNAPYRVIDPVNTVSVNGSASPAGILSASISLATGLVGTEYTIGNGRFIATIPEGQSRVTGSMSVQFSNDYYQQLFWAATGATSPGANVLPATLAFTIKSPTTINGALKYGIQIILNNVLLTSAPTPGRSGSTINQTINFEAYQSAAGADDDIKLIVTDGSSVAA